MREEQVFIILKPDTISRNLIDEIVRRFRAIGRFEWVSGRTKNKDWCRRHYKHIFTDSKLVEVQALLDNFMVGNLLIGLNLWGPNCILKARELAGATRVKDAKSGTIRGDLGLRFLPTCYNLVHVADSPEAVTRETILFLDRTTDYDFGILPY